MSAAREHGSPLKRTNAEWQTYIPLVGAQSRAHLNKSVAFRPSRSISLVAPTSGRARYRALSKWCGSICTGHAAVGLKSSCSVPFAGRRRGRSRLESRDQHYLVCKVTWGVIIEARIHSPDSIRLPEYPRPRGTNVKPKMYLARHVM